MARVKGSVQTRARRKKVLKQAKGYFGSKKLLYRTAKEQVMRSLQYAYIHRRLVKRDFRKLWIKRINAASRNHDMSYSQFMYGLRLANVEINRKMLSEIAIHDDQTFASLIKTSKDAIAKQAK
ncbi:MAG: 50S ribosomal protein L20 [Erysipelotrichaceae bacterium]|nr:50S ribosomal protein L20 [Erysipelotrichaceae bacterium]